MNTCETCDNHATQGVNGTMLNCCHHKEAVNPVTHYRSEAICSDQRDSGGFCGPDGSRWEPRKRKGGSNV